MLSNCWHLSSTLFAQKESEAYLPILTSKDGRSLRMHDLLNAQLWTFKYRLDKLFFFFALMFAAMSYSTHMIFVVPHFYYLSHKIDELPVKEAWWHDYDGGNLF